MAKRPQELRSLSEARKALPSFREMIDQIVEFNGKTDFANVLIASTLLDQVLTLALKSKMNGSEKFKKEMINYSGGPMGTFSARIKTGWAMGIYNEPVYKGMDAIRDIRNTFAHTTHDLTFHNPVIVEATRRLAETIWDDYKVDPSNAAGDFIHAIVALIFALEAHISPHYRDDPRTS
jgi:hypothetical protein